MRPCGLRVVYDGTSVFLCVNSRGYNEMLIGALRRAHASGWSREPTLPKPTKMKDELAGLVARAVADAIGASGVVPPFVEGHTRDGMGRDWDVSLPAPTPTHRKAIDSIRDLYDLG